MKALKQWRQEGGRLIVCMDANKDIYKKSIGKTLTDRDGLNMVEAVGEFTGKKIGPTFFSRLKTNQRDLDHGIGYHNSCLHDACRVRCGRPSYLCNGSTKSQPHWRSALLCAAIHLKAIKHQGINRGNTELSCLPGGQPCMTLPYRMHREATQD